MTDNNREELKGAIRRRGQPLTDMQKLVNGRRIRAGRALVQFYAENDGREHLGEAIVKRYLEIPGRGDEYDLQSTVVDAIADMLHFGNSRGIAADNIISAMQVRDGEVLCDGIAQAIDELRPVLTDAGEDFSDAIRMAREHLGAETRSLSY